MTFEKVQAIIANQLGIDEAEVQLTTDFENDLKADSLDVFQIISEIVCISLIDKSENSLILSEVSSINRISLKIETKNSFISKMVEWSTHYHPFNLF